MDADLIGCMAAISFWTGGGWASPSSWAIGSWERFMRDRIMLLCPISLRVILVTIQMRPACGPLSWYPPNDYYKLPPNKLLDIIPRPSNHQPLWFAISFSPFRPLNNYFLSYLNRMPAFHLCRLIYIAIYHNKKKNENDNLSNKI